MARAGWYHNDLEWRHLALLPVKPTADNEKWTVKPILLDLADMERLHSGPVAEGSNLPQDVKDRIAGSIQYLKSKMDPGVLDSMKADPSLGSPESPSDEPVVLY